MLSQLFVVFTLFLPSFFCGQLPSNLQRCSRSDPKFQECLRIAMEDALPKLADGIKELSMPNLEPVNIPSATIKEGSGPVNVAQKYTNFNIHNVTKSKVNKLSCEIDDKTLKMDIEASSSSYVLTADYDFNGRILLLPIVGKGKCTIVLTDVVTNWNFMGDKFQKKGKTYLEVKTFGVKLNPGKVHFDFENLFNGDERLGNELSKVVNENWRAVFDDVKSGYEELISSIGKFYSNIIYTKVPFDDIFLK